jgi:hypothetical protein
MFWTAMGLLFVGFAVAITGAVVAAFTVVGIPAAIGVEQAAIRQKVRDLGSTWAMPNTADMADASDADGEGSDWRLGS